MEKIKEIRLEVGMSQRELAESIKSHYSTYSLIESGRLVPVGFDKIRKDALKILIPKLIEKIMDVRSELNRLESLSLTK